MRRTFLTFVMFSVGCAQTPDRDIRPAGDGALDHGSTTPRDTAVDRGVDTASSLDEGIVDTAAEVSECGGGLRMCGSVCVNTDSSRVHCGRCNNPCEAGYICSEGACECVRGRC